MKKIRLLLTLSIVVSVFTICFLIGRATVAKEKEENDTVKEKYEGTAVIPRGQEEIDDVTAEAKNVEKSSQEESAEEDGNYNNAPEEELPPPRMLFPCGSANVSKNYSQTAVYSKTTDDWRAHLGIDYAAPIGTDVVSTCDGVVLSVYNDKLWGNCIEILHKGNVLGIYRNLQDGVSVKQEDAVSEGQVIGKVGNSASVEHLDEPHLHFETWKDGVSVNPESFIY